MSRVLAVWPYAPWPAVTGTSRRLARLTEELAAHHTVGVVVADSVVAEAPPPGIELVGQTLRRRSNLTSAAALPGVLARRDPYFHAFYRRRGVRAVIARAIEKWQPDFVWTHGLAGDALVRGLVDDGRLLLDLSDAEHRRFARLGAAVGGARGQLWSADVARVERWVRNRLPQVRAVTVVSADDRDAYAELAPTARFLLVPNGVDPAPVMRLDPGGGTVVFLGDLGYPPNAEAIEWFASHVLPRTDAVDRLLVVGRGAAPAVPKVQATGFVADLDDVWSVAAAMVIPVRSGGGTRLKALDAFGAGVPVVSTEFGVSGLDVEPGIHYLAAETPEEFVAGLTRLLADDALRRDLAVAAHRHVRERFTWEACVEPVARLARQDSD